MFDSRLYADLRQSVDTAAAGRTETALATGAQVCDSLREIQRAMDVLDGVQADLLARLDDTKGYEGEGASSTTGWASRELRLTAGQVRQRMKAGRTLQRLSAASAALAEGRIRLDHVHELTAGITKIGGDLMDEAQSILMPVAEASDPKELRTLVDHLNNVVHPDDLNNKYAKGMDKRDIKVARCGDGFHLSGYLDQLTGTKLHSWLKAASKPECESDDRAPSDRRVDSFGRLLEDTVASASATDQSDTRSTSDGGDDADSQQAARRTRPRPQLLVLADLETLLRMPGAEPATLEGFGPIGSDLLGYLTCLGDLTGLLTHGFTDGPTPQADVLNVGRTARLATAAQKKAISARQRGTCASPGCGLARLEFHHVAWWGRDHGPTDLDNLVGLCSRCHHLVHAEKLIINADGAGGFIFRRKTGRRIDDHTRQIKHRVREALVKIRYAAAAADAGPPHTSGPARPRHPERAARPDVRWQTRKDSQLRTAAEVHLDDCIGRHRPART